MLDRRHFLIAGGLVPAGFLGLRHLMSDRPLYKDADLVDPGYGPLQRDPRGILDLPEGFRYRIVSWAGQTMSDGLFLPGAPDGMAAFPGPDGLAVVICNHELTVQSDRGPFGRDNRRLELLDRGKIYDYGEGKTPSCGGTTTFLFDPARQEIVSQFLSLAGTIRNCAGGATPWNSWISCEETVRTAGHDEEAGLWAEQDHGYNFEVPATTRMEVVDPVPLRAMGRFNHEAVAVAEETGIVYQTEDRGDGLLYRFLPESPGKLQAGGRLQALKIRDRSGMDTRNWNLWRTISVGEPVAVEWIDLDDPEPREDNLRYRGYEAGAARFARGEGMWYGNETVYFACTNGGYRRNGQIWKYRPSSAEGTPEESQAPGTLELFIEPDDVDLLKSADNLTLSPWGDLVLCEDRSTEVVRLIGVTPEGRCYILANNRLRTEFAGAVFTPDGSTLLVNIQQKGLTVAITGPWSRA